jgi:hypothetical protein
MGIPQREVSSVQAAGEKLEPWYLQFGQIVMIEPDESRRQEQEPPINCR